MARIVTLYAGWRTPVRLIDMSIIRWIKISEALARRGHQVDIATNELAPFRWWSKLHLLSTDLNVRTVPLKKIRWDEYDVVKTSYHLGFEALHKFGGATHPFIISNLGSVVSSRDIDGVYFYGKNRERLYELQEQINASSRYVTVLNASAKQLWHKCHGHRENVLLVPGGVDSEIPKPGGDPFPDDTRPRCIFAGNIYDKKSQPEANSLLTIKLNQLGERLTQLGIRLYFLGSGDTRRLDRRYVTILGSVPYERTWDYFHFSNVGIVVAAGTFMHNNESTKIYHYLRAGLPTVTERGFPNDKIVAEANLGFVVENGNLTLMAEKIQEAAVGTWNKQRSIDYIIRNHTWDRRVEVYHDLISNEIRK